MRLQQMWTMMVAATIVLPTVARAQFVTYTSQSSFLAAITNPGVDTFTGFTVGESTSSPLARTAGVHSYGVSVTGGDPAFGAGTVGNPWLSVEYATHELTFSNFSSGVAAVGGYFFGSDAGGQFASGDMLVTYVDATGAQSQTLFAPSVDMFFGVVSLTGAITSFSVSAVQPADDEPLWPTVENLTLGEAPASRVPEPATAVLVVTGLLAMGLSARRRQA